jgi:hypothetical protein
MLTGKILKTLFINILILVLLVEAVSFIYLSVTGIPLGKYDRFPTYLNFSLDDELMDVDSTVLHPRVIDSTLPWGIWHLPNVQSRQYTPCFDIVMKYNRYGIRGPVPDTGRSDNVIFIGDSFTEGYGLSEDHTIPAQFSDLSKRPAINLGVSRTGSTQQSMIYQHFADSFNHREVVMLMFLENDFIDNDFEKHDTLFKISYKPYRADSLDPSHIIYRGHPDSSALSSRWFNSHIDEYRKIIVRKGLKSYFQTDNLSFFGKLTGLTYTRRMFELLGNGLSHTHQIETVPPGLDYRPRDLEILSYDMHQVMETANRHGARVTFVNLPGQRFLERMASHPEDRKSYLVLEDHLRRIAGAGPHRFLSYFSALEAKKPDMKQIFFSCDAHYSQTGARMAATFLSDSFK